MIAAAGRRETFPGWARLTPQSASGSTSPPRLFQTQPELRIQSSMNAARRPLLAALLALAIASLLGGCISPKSTDTIPGNRPADWEGQIPGMGSGPGFGGR